MATNAWTHRRWRLPRPPVCKSYPKLPATGGPPSPVMLQISWAGIVGGNLTTFNGLLPLDPTADPIVWHIDFSDDQAQPVQIDFNVEPVGTLSVLQFAAQLANGFSWVTNTTVNGWDGSYPFQYNQGDLLDPNSTPVGVFTVELTRAP